MSTAVYSDRDNLAALAWAMAAPGASETVTKLLMPDVRAGCDTAVRMLSMEVWKSDFDKGRMMKSFNATLSGTTGGAKASLDPLLIAESISPKYGGFAYSSTLEAVGITGYLDYYEDFPDASIPHNFEGVGAYLIRGESPAAEIWCFDETGTGARFNGTQITVKGAIHYDFATVPEYYKHRVVAILVQLCREKLAGLTSVRQTIGGDNG